MYWEPADWKSTKNQKIRCLNDYLTYYMYSNSYTKRSVGAQRWATNGLCCIGGLHLSIWSSNKRNDDISVHLMTICSLHTVWWTMWPIMGTWGTIAQRLNDTTFHMAVGRTIHAQWVVWPIHERMGPPLHTTHRLECLFRTQYKSMGSDHVI